MTLFVSPAGSDENSGESEDAPKLSIESAYEAISAALEEADEEARGTIYVMEGTTILTGTSHASFWWLDLEKPVTIEGFGAPREKCIILANSANEHRMHFRVSHPAVVISGVTLTGGRYANAGDDGNGAGSIYMTQGVVSNCVIHSNMGGASSSPGAVRMFNHATAYPRLTECVISNNLSGGNGTSGHGVRIADGSASSSGISALVDKCIFDNNRNGTGYNYSGSTVSIQSGASSSAVVRDCVISRDTSNSTYGYAYGGGVYMQAGLLERCVITNNTVANNGAGVYISGGALVNCLIAQNKARAHGGGVYANGGTLINNTIVGNSSANNTSGGIYVAGNSVILLNNISFDNNSGSTSPERNFAFASSANSGKVIDYNVFFPESCLGGVKVGVAGAHNIFADPLLVSLTAPYDYTLQSASPCVDTAATPEMIAEANYITAATLATPPFSNADFFADVIGTVRPKNGNVALANLPDIGAYEGAAFTEGEFRCAFTRDISSAQQLLDPDNIDTNANLVAVTFTPSVAGAGVDDPDCAITFSWTVTDVFGNSFEMGVSSPDDANGGAIVAHFPVGTYDVMLDTYDANSGARASAAIEKAVHIAAPWAYVSTTGKSVAPYYREEDAARYVDEAIAVLVPADDDKNSTRSTVFVAPGEYRVRGFDLTIDAPITVKSVAGPDETTLLAWGSDDPATQAKKSPRRVVNMNNSNAVLDGFALTGFAGASDGSVILQKGMITNCIVRDNAGTESYISPGVYMTGGKLVDCVLRGNYTSYKWDTAHALTISGGTVSSCVITNNGYNPTRNGHGNGTYYGVVNMNGGVLTNCVISQNYVNCDWDGYHGALYLQNGTVVNCAITSNYCYRADGALSAAGVCMSGNSVLRQCLIAGNYGATGAKGYIGLNQAGGTVESCTIADNAILSPEATGVYMSGGTAINNIYHNNGAKGDLLVSAASVANGVSYCCFAQAADSPFDGADAHNISADPRLNSKYRPRASSPCRKSGTIRPWMTGAYDLTGNPLLGLGTPIPRLRFATPEMGCFEIANSGPTLLMLR